MLRPSLAEPPVCVCVCPHVQSHAGDVQSKAGTGTSVARHNFHERQESQLNAHINVEFTASYVRLERLFVFVLSVPIVSSTERPLFHLWAFIPDLPLAVQSLQP